MGFPWGRRSLSPPAAIAKWGNGRVTQGKVKRPQQSVLRPFAAYGAYVKQEVDTLRVHKNCLARSGQKGGMQFQNNVPRNHFSFLSTRMVSL